MAGRNTNIKLTAYPSLAFVSKTPKPTMKNMTPCFEMFNNKYIQRVAEARTMKIAPGNCR
jgi:hypothetical protein